MKRQIDDKVNDLCETGNKTWQRRALLAELLHGPKAETDGPFTGKAGAGCGTRADHRDDVVAPDGARQSAQARGDAALQAYRRAFLGGIWPRRQSGPAPADERGPSCGD